MRLSGDLTSSRGFRRAIFRAVSPSGSRFIGEPTLVLHAHRRRVPAQDVDRSVVVGVGEETAMTTDEARLAFAAFSVDGSAARASLRRIGSVDLRQVATKLLQFVGQDGFEGRPSLIQDGSIEAGFRPISRSARRCGHAANIQLLDAHQPKALGERQSGLVVPVAAYVRSPSRQLGAALQGTRPSVGAALAAGQDALGRATLALKRPKACRKAETLASRERYCVCDTAIETNGLGATFWSGDLDLTREADVPARRGECDRDVLDRAADRPRIPEFHPADLGHTHFGPFGRQFAHTDLATQVSERVILASAPRGRVPSTAGKECAEGLVQVAECLLLTHLWNSSNPIKLAPHHGQFAGLRDIADVTARIGAILSPPVGSLIERDIVDQPAHPSELAKHRLHFSGRGQLVPKRSMQDHARNMRCVATEFNRPEKAASMGEVE